MTFSKRTRVINGEITQVVNVKEGILVKPSEFRLGSKKVQIPK